MQRDFFDEKFDAFLRKKNLEKNQASVAATFCVPVNFTSKDHFFDECESDDFDSFFCGLWFSGHIFFYF